MAEIDDLLKYLKELDGRTQLGPASEATLTRLADHFTKSSASAPKTPIEKKEQKAKKRAPNCEKEHQKQAEEPENKQKKQAGEGGNTFHLETLQKTK